MKDKGERQNKYNKANSKVVPVRLNYHTDQDILERLEREDSVAGYIKDLIRADMVREQDAFDEYKVSSGKMASDDAEELDKEEM